jgi:secernin
VCDTVAYVSPGLVAFAKNSDRDPNEAQFPEWLPPAEYAAGQMLRCTWTIIEQARQTLPVLISRPFCAWGAEMGANSAGLVIGNEAVFTKQPFDQPGLTGMDLVRLALERAQSVDQAIEVIKDLIAKHGQGGRAGYANSSFQYHNSFLMADPQGAAVLEAAGRECAVERVSSGCRAISNGLTIPTLQRQADRVRAQVSQCRLRRTRMEASGSLYEGPASLARALRDHGSANGLPKYQRLNGALSAPCVHYGGWVAGSQTVASWISTLSVGNCQHWITGTSSPCLSLFRPVSLLQSHDVGRPQGFPDQSSLWWRFERLHRTLMRDWSQAQQMQAERDELERSVFQTPQDERAHWQAADAWLSRWEQQLTLSSDTRPRWLRKLWANVEAQAAEGNRLPPR